MIGCTVSNRWHWSLIVRATSSRKGRDFRGLELKLSKLCVALHSTGVPPVLDATRSHRGGVGEALENQE